MSALVAVTASAAAPASPLAAGQAPEAAASSPPAVAAPPVAVPGLFPDRGDESFTEAIEVSVVNVDVVVRDKAGKQVAGLTRDDFALLVDGQKVDVTNFYALGGAGGRQPPATSAAGAASPPVPAGADAGSVAKRERLDLVIYVDNANLHPFDRNRILKQLRTLLRTLGPEDQFLLVTHDMGMGLSVRHGFRESASTLGPALDKLEKEMAGGISKDLAQRQAMDDIQRLGCRQVNAAESVAQGYADGVLAEVKMTYASLYHLLGSLGGQCRRPLR